MKFSDNFQNSNYTNFKKFCNGIKGDLEDQINKLKTIKKIMYGKGSFELLKVKVLNA